MDYYLILDQFVSDEYHYHEVINRTNSLMSEEGKSLRIRENKYLQEIFYNGSDKKGTY